MSMATPTPIVIGPTLLSAVSATVERLTGLHFPPDRHADLLRGLQRAAGYLDLPSAQACAETLLKDTLTCGQIDVLASCLTVGETYFLRDQAAFQLLAERILPEIIEKRRRTTPFLRLWSAGCCTGEEAYSLAIILDRLLPDRAAWNLTILATDINPTFLSSARTAVFRPWSFRNAPAWLKSEYFHQIDAEHFELRDDIRRMVTFNGLNLVEDSYPSPMTNTNAMDVIFCRNVLMYFTPARTDAVLERLSRSLSPDGVLFVGAAEANRDLMRGFTVRMEFGALCYRKANRSPQPPPVTVPPRSIKPHVTKPSSRGPQVPSRRIDMTRRVPIEASEDVVDRETDGLDTVRCHADRGDLAAALDAANTAIAACRTSIDAYLLRASILQELGRDDEAEVDLKRCLYLDSTHVPACVLGGRLALRRGDAKRGHRLFATASRLLEGRQEGELLHHAEGMTVGQLKRMLAVVLEGENK